jgi:hypothetical protein
MSLHLQLLALCLRPPLWRPSRVENLKRHKFKPQNQLLRKRLKRHKPKKAEAQESLWLSRSSYRRAVVVLKQQPRSHQHLRPVRLPRSHPNQPFSAADLATRREQPLQQLTEALHLGNRKATAVSQVVARILCPLPKAAAFALAVARKQEMAPEQAWAVAARQRTAAAVVLRPARLHPA